MQKTARSLGFAVSGLIQALKAERNLRAFVLAHIVIVALGLLLRFGPPQWILIGFFAGIFITAELLNTALERLADTVDDLEKQRMSGHFHPGIKAVKDIAAAASLIALLMDSIFLVLLFAPHLLLLVSHYG